MVEWLYVPELIAITQSISIVQKPSFGLFSKGTASRV
jgi:hypothetical protein